MEVRELGSLASVAASSGAAIGALAVFTCAWREERLAALRRLCILPALLAGPAVCEVMVTGAAAWVQTLCWLAFLWSLQAAAVVFAIPVTPPRPAEAEVLHPGWWADFERAFRAYASERT